MTAIDRTAYPRPADQLTREELDGRYNLSEADRAFIRTTARNDAGRLTLATLLKARQDLGCFPALLDMHCDTVAYLALRLALAAVPRLHDETRRKATLHRYRAAIRTYLKVKPYAAAGEQLVTQAVLEAATTMSDPADLINRAIEVLIKAATDLPAFSTLERLANHLRAQVHTRMYGQITARLTPAQVASLDALLIVQPDAVTTSFNRLKQTPGPARAQTIRLWTDRLGWLANLVDPEPILDGITHTKLRQFAAEAAAMEVSDLLGMSRPGKRHTLLLSLLRQARSSCRDELIEMLLRRVRKTQAAAKEKLRALQDQHSGMEEALIGIFGQVLQTAKDEDSDAQAGQQIRTLLAEQGGIESLAEQCLTVSAWHSNNDLPLLWKIHTTTRTLLLRLLELMEIRSATQDRSLLDALAVVLRHRHAHRDDLTETLDLSFCSQRWQSFVSKRATAPVILGRRALEVCVFVHLADALQTGDLYVVGAENFGDYRTQLLPWTTCKSRLADYCDALAMPQTGKAFVAQLKQQLATTAAEVDASFPANSDLTIDADGVPHLKKQPPGIAPAGLEAFQTQLHARLPERHLLDILKNSAFWTRYTRHFGPASGIDAKLARPEQRYIVTVFGYASNLGPSQTARHAPGIAAAETLRRINAQHIDTPKLEAATTDLVNAYARFALPRLWGAGHVAIADGTHVPLRENNLIGAQHIRYGGYGGIAYHHIADSYIALFTSFIPCGVWEAVHILDGLIKNRSALQPDTLHADSQGQSEPVFGLCRLLGIKLMPRMRNWDDVAFYRPSKSSRYQHIDALFTKEIDWRLIETHWQDMMQVVLSIQAGLVLPSMLLRKLGSHNRKSLLCLAFRELGRVERTIFLLRYISTPAIRQAIRAETTKIESFNDFLDWITFGGPIIKSADPIEQEKQLKYTTLMANAIMLSNVVDLTDALTSMAADGLPVTAELAASLSPYTRRHLRRFGQYEIDMNDLPAPLTPGPLPFKVPL
jgi:TnpA family transposase